MHRSVVPILLWRLRVRALKRKDSWRSATRLMDAYTATPKIVVPVVWAVTVSGTCFLRSGEAGFRVDVTSSA